MELDPLNRDAQNLMTIKKLYIHANSQILAQHDGDGAAERYFYTHDRLGSVRSLFDTDGDTQAHYLYDPLGFFYFGLCHQIVSNQFWFTGQWIDFETLQYDLRARQYNPYIGRFTTRDLLAGKFENPLTLHRYLYCGNDPINRIDLNGLWTVHITGTVMASLGWSGVRQSGIVIDDDGNIGWINITGIGGGTPAASLGGSVGWTNADKIFDLQGKGLSIGGSISAFGGEFMLGRQRSGDLYEGFELTFSPLSAPVPAEMHAHYTDTKIYPSKLKWRDTKDRIKHYIEDEAIYNARTWGRATGLITIWGYLY